MIDERYPARVRIREVSPRDGLQNESIAVDVATKVALIDALAAAGLRAIECGSFVSAKHVPQMANTADVLASIRRTPGVRYSVLVPNLQGLDAAMRSEAAEIAIFAAASESFSRHNIHCSIDEGLSRFRAVAEQALAHRMRVRGYVSCVLGCPYEGSVAPKAVTRVVRSLMDMGCYEVSLGDTVGVGTPRAAQALIKQVAEQVPVEPVSGTLSRHLRPGAGEHSGGAATRGRGRRRRSGRLGRMSLRTGRDRQCRNRRCGLHAERYEY